MANEQTVPPKYPKYGFIITTESDDCLYYLSEYTFTPTTFTYSRRRGEAYVFFDTQAVKVIKRVIDDLHEVKSYAKHDRQFVISIETITLLDELTILLP